MTKRAGTRELEGGGGRGDGGMGKEEFGMVVKPSLGVLGAKGLGWGAEFGRGVADWRKTEEMRMKNREIGRLRAINFSLEGKDSDCDWN